MELEALLCIYPPYDRVQGFSLVYALAMAMAVAQVPPYPLLPCHSNFLIALHNRSQHFRYGDEERKYRNFFLNPKLWWW
jgi:hypothetical protein